VSSPDQEQNFEIEEISEQERIAKIQSLSNFSFYFGTISLLLFSWLFQLIIWKVFEITGYALYLYLIAAVGFPLGGLVCGVLARKTKKGLIGLIINGIIILSFIGSSIALLVVSLIN